MRELTRPQLAAVNALADDAPCVEVVAVDRLTGVAMFTTWTACPAEDPRAVFLARWHCGPDDARAWQVSGVGMGPHV